MLQRLTDVPWKDGRRKIFEVQSFGIEIQRKVQ